MSRAARSGGTFPPRTFLGTTILVRLARTRWVPGSRLPGPSAPVWCCRLDPWPSCIFPGQQQPGSQGRYRPDEDGPFG
jgi:hypothetical protein